MVTILGNSYSRPDFFLAAAAGAIPGVSVVKKFGFNPAVGATEEAIWDEGGPYAYLPAPSQLTVSSTDTTDNPLGTGAHSVVLSGLDANNLEASELMVMDGQNPVTTTNTYNRVFRAFVQTAGVNGCADGIIRFGTGAVVAGVPAITYARISPGLNQTRMAIYTVPANKTAFVYELFSSAGKGQEVEVRIYARALGGVFRLQGQTNMLQNIFVSPNAIPSAIPGSTDIEVRGAALLASATVNSSFDMILIDNDIPIR